MGDSITLGYDPADSRQVVTQGILQGRLYSICLYGVTSRGSYSSVFRASQVDIYLSISSTFVPAYATTPFSSDFHHDLSFFNATNRSSPRFFTSSLSLMICSLAPTQAFRFPMSNRRHMAGENTPFLHRL